MLIKIITQLYRIIYIKLVIIKYNTNPNEFSSILNLKMTK